MRPDYTEPTQTFFIILWRRYCTCQIDHTQTYSWSNLVQYIERSWYWWLQESGNVNELHTRHHCPTIDPVNRQDIQYKLVHWYRICGAKGHEESHWWFRDHGNRRGLCPIQKTKTKHQDFNWVQYCWGGWFPDPGDLDPIFPEKPGLRDQWKCYQ